MGGVADALSVNTGVRIPGLIKYSPVASACYLGTMHLLGSKRVVGVEHVGKNRIGTVCSLGVVGEVALVAAAAILMPEITLAVAVAGTVSNYLPRMTRALASSISLIAGLTMAYISTQ